MNYFVDTCEHPVADNSDDVVGEGTVTSSCGNVFADLGLENPVEGRLKADLVMLIQDQIKRLGLTQARAATLMGISQPDVSKLLKGRTGVYSLERVLAFVRALGGDVDINVRASAAPREGRAKAAPREGRMKLRVELEPA